MEKQYYLAIDIGASSGRHILAWLENGKLMLEEIYRFSNGAHMNGEKFVWDDKNLFESIIQGLIKCKELGKIPKCLGIDTWGVDYALLDENDQMIGEIYSYRDKRTYDAVDHVYDIISEKELYKRTGIARQTFNTIFQLYNDKTTGKISGAKTFLMMPDYLNFLLTGVKKNEYTNATTTNLINAKERCWDYEIIDKLGYPREIFQDLALPGTVLGELKQEIQDIVGFNTNVCVVSSHDTASAVMAVPNLEKPLYISSGTWSLFGIETEQEITNEVARESGFTNEGGFNKSITLLKNIMGLWMIQCVKKEYQDKYSFTDFVALANEAQGFNSIVDVNDMSFFAPKSMIQAVKDYCKKTGQKVPKTVGEIVLCIYQSLAKCYAEAVEQIEEISGEKYSAINIVGGGCQNVLLNELTAKFTKRTVVAGPVEATAIGNVLAQMLAYKQVDSLEQAKIIVKNSFDIKEIK